eukprot:3878169-Pleurochrysis_carterae.AAC.2
MAAARASTQTWRATAAASTTRSRRWTRAARATSPPTPQTCTRAGTATTERGQRMFCCSGTDARGCD